MSYEAIRELPSVRRLRNALQDIAAWTDVECLGYKPFVMAVSNQIPFLTSLINTRERRMSMVNTRVRTSSTSSLTLETSPQTPAETKIPATQKAQEVTKQVVTRKDSPATVPDTSAEKLSISLPPRPPPTAKDEASTCAIM
ncbi:hypothetical protein O0L34_g7860 [Tuta absoluta]|nr:hypothetical protein O0L34_g7860 [Tuta absoluta]